jgi:hypothetical protein
VQSKSRFRLARPALQILLAAALGGGVAIFAAVAFAKSLSTVQAGTHRHPVPAFVQNSHTGDDTEIPSAQVEKYVAVYKDMQRNHSLTVEKAAAKEGLSIGEFRRLEQKIERDNSARERVRTELQAAAAETPSPVSAPTPPPN